MSKLDKEIVEDPIESLDFVKAPPEGREGPISDVVSDGLNSKVREHEFVEKAAEHDKPGSYHYSDTKRGHWSQSSGCTTKSYLDYVFKQDDSLEKPDHDDKTKRVFTHGDLVHLWIQGIFLEELGEEFVTIEEQIDEELQGDYGTSGHVDIVIRNHPNFPDPFVIDIKTKAEFTYYNYSKNGHSRSIPSESNLKQLMGYMHHIGAEVGALLYYSKRNDHIEEYWVKFDEEMFEKGKSQILNVLNHVNTGEVPDKDAEPYMCDPDYCVYRREGICPGVDEADDWEGDGDKLEEFEYENPEWD